MSRRYHKKSTQLTIKDTLIIPSDKPDIEFLLRLTATPTIDKAAAADKKITFSGHILIYIEYVAGVPDGTQPIHFASFELPFDDMISHRRVRTDMNIQLKGSVESQEFQIISPRNIQISVNFNAFLERLARAYETLPPHLCMPCTNVCKPDNLRCLLPTQPNS
jgi:hypothetical protein